jgi:nucleotide-binding universal stress UspA family protein
MRLGWRYRDPERRPGQPRLLVPFSDRQLDPAVLDAALRIARAEEAVLVPAYLLVVPLEFSLEAPVQHEELGRAMPILEAVELAARRAGVPVDARIERGRSPIDTVSRLWEAESFDRIVVPAPAPGRGGFSGKDIAWMLAHGPGEILVLRPAPDAEDGRSNGTTTPTTPAG